MAMHAILAQARTGARAAFCPEPTRRAILAEIDQLVPSATKKQIAYAGQP